PTFRLSKAPMPLLLLLFLQLCGRCNGASKCLACDNYFELNLRNLDTTSKSEILKRYCGIEARITDSNQADCGGADYDGCVKIVTRSYRYHIDREGVGMRAPETLISTVVTRDCAEIPKAMGVGCHMLYGAGSTTEMCYCKGDYCNAAGRLQLQHGLLMGHLLLLLLSVVALRVTGL
ncbi:hypothetical protein BOX15_Mlig027592g3, partial [Macrostomum lignano]